MERNWEQELELDENLTDEEKTLFLELITNKNIPSIEEFAEAAQKSREEMQEKYWDKYGKEITATRDMATSIKIMLKGKQINIKELPKEIRKEIAAQIINEDEPYILVEVVGDVDDSQFILGGGGEQ